MFLNDDVLHSPEHGGDIVRVRGTRDVHVQLFVVTPPYELIPNELQSGVVLIWAGILGEILLQWDLSGHTDTEFQQTLTTRMLIALTLTIFSAKRSRLLRKRIKDVLANHRRTTVSANNFKASSIRFVTPSSYNTLSSSDSTVHHTKRTA